jgi:hypothetical protein
MENMKKLSILSWVLLLAIGLLAPGCKKKEDASGKGQEVSNSYNLTTTQTPNSSYNHKNCKSIRLVISKA